MYFLFRKCKFIQIALLVLFRRNLRLCSNKQSVQRCLCHQNPAATPIDATNTDPITYGQYDVYKKKVNNTSFNLKSMQNRKGSNFLSRLENWSAYMF